MGIKLELDRPLPEDFEAGRGGCLVLQGRIAAQPGAVNALYIDAGTRTQVELYPAVQDEKGQQSQPFFAMIEIPKRMTGSILSVTARAVLSDNSTLEKHLGECAIVGTRLQPLKLPEIAVVGDVQLPLVAICMAAYNPEPAAFRRQIDSILTQTHGNWICIINDDASPVGCYREMAEVCAQDPRLSLHRNQQNLGFYANFEQALRRVPEAADFIAFTDQDDDWYPNKLERLLRAMQGGAQLSYSDMRIVDNSGTVVAETYWQGRKNEYQDFSTVLLANTVTGAASLFQRKLLYDLLPFPARLGDAFHDHWVACVALAKGRIEYVDEPLYSYYQHGESVIGHCDFSRWTLRQRAASLGRFAQRMLRPAERRSLLGRKVGSSLAVYRGECLRLELFARTIKLRLRQGDAIGGALNLFNGGLPSVFKLLATHLKILATGRTTDDAEFRLAMGYLARYWEKRRMKTA